MTVRQSHASSSGQSTETRRQTQSVDAILDAAEELFGKFGFSSVSLRRIARESGTQNNFAVQYHFGDKADLARAVLLRRLALLEVERAEMLAVLRRPGGDQDPRALFEALMRPLAERMEDPNVYNYARFMRQLFCEWEFAGLRTAVADHAPISQHITDRLRQTLTGVPDAVFDHRIGSCTLLFLNLLVDEGTGGAARAAPFHSWREKVNAAVDAAFAALSQPIPARG